MDLLYGLFVIFILLRGLSSVQVTIDNGKTGVVRKEVFVGNNTFLQCSGIPEKKNEKYTRLHWHYGTNYPPRGDEKFLCHDGMGVQCDFFDRLELLYDRGMFIWHTEVADSGFYRCTAVLEGDTPGHDDAYFELIVMAPLNEISAGFPPQNAIFPGKSVKFTCQEVERKANPPPTFRWFKDGRMLPNSSADDPLYSNLNFSVDVTSGILKIHEVSEADFGEYQCEAYHKLGNRKSKLSSILGPIAPKVIHCGLDAPGNVLSLGRQDQKLFCNADDEARPLPAMKWYRNGKEMVKETTLDSSYDPVNGTVIFKNPTAEDATEYQCIATTIEGPMKCPSFRVALGIPPTSIKCEFPSGKTIILGRDHEFRCGEVEVTAFPKPAISWKKAFFPEYKPDPRHPDWGDAINSTGGVLKLTSVNWTDEGQYACIIENAAGFIHCDGIVRVVEYGVGSSGNLSPWIIVEAFLVVFTSVFMS